MGKDRAYYFKFDATTWLAASSKVQLLSYAEKGMFIEVCAMVLIENGSIKCDEMLHRKLRVDETTANQWLKLVSELKLVVIENGYLSVKFISESLNEMTEEKIKRIENGKKGGRPKTKAKYPSKNENKNYIKEKEKEKEKPHTAFLIPKILDTLEFREAFERWENYCVQNRISYLGEIRTSTLITLKNLAKAKGVDAAIGAIDNGINKKLKYPCEPFGAAKPREGDFVPGDGMAEIAARKAASDRAFAEACAR